MDESTEETLLEGDSGMVATARTLLSSSAGVQLTTAVNFNGLFLYPRDDAHVEDGDDSTQRMATIVITIIVRVAPDAQPPEPIESLTADLIGNETLAFPSGSSETNTFSYAKGEAREAASLSLKPGQTYRWNVALQVKHDATPCESNKYGRVFQTIFVNLKWADSRYMKKYKNLEVKRRIWLVCIPRRSNNLAYSRIHETAVDIIGPVAIYLRTPNLIVGGHLRFGLSLASLSPNCVLQTLTLSIIQKAVLTSRRTGHQEICPPEHISVLKVEGDELKKYIDASKGSLEGHWVARLETDNTIRPTTLPGSQANIRLTHMVEVGIVYLPERSKSVQPLRYRAAWPMVMASCGCRPQSLELPTYSEKDPVRSSSPTSYLNESIQVAVEQNKCTPCTCDLSMAELLKHDNDYKQTKDWSVAQHISRENQQLLPSEIGNQADTPDRDALQAANEEDMAERRRQKALQSYVAT